MRSFGVEPDEVIEEFVVEEVDVGEEQVFKASSLRAAPSVIVSIRAA
jgi:hypothetical protein